MIAIQFLQLCREQTEKQINPHTVFPKIPTIHIEPEELVCTCESHPKLKVIKTKQREVRTMHIGPFYVHETVKACPIKNCKKTYRYTALDNFLPPGSNFGYDVIEYIGHAVWGKSHTALQIQADLRRQNNLTISESEIAYLAKKFVIYVFEAHKDKQSEIRRFLHRGGGYFLYFDAMHPGDGAAHLMCAIAEEISERVSIVLGSVKLPKESTETVAAFLRELKEKYGDPAAGVCDMLASNLAAFQEVFPSVSLLICHFHYLRGLGKFLLEYENTLLDGFLKQYDVSSRLKEIANKCRATIGADPKLAKYLEYDEKTCNSSLQLLPEVVKTYFMVMWIRSYKQELNGYGFPFDRANLVYFQRMNKIFQTFKDIPEACEELSELKYFLASVLTDPKFKIAMAKMEKKVRDFDRVRDIMKIAPIEGVNGLNDNGEECDMTAMEKQLKKFIESDEIKNNSDSSYKKLIKQTLKYWKLLFAKPVEVLLQNGETVFIYAQRTSNCMERLFREFLREECKRTGMDTLGRRVRTMIAETPMMKNLKCSDYLKIILNGQPSLAARFAELDIEHARKQMEESHNEETLPFGIKKIIKDVDFYKNFMITPNKTRKVA